MKKALKRGRSQKSAKFRKVPRKARGSYISAVEQELMCIAYNNGGKDNTIGKIAKRFGRNRDTVAKIVKSETQVERARKIGETFFLNTAEAAAVRVHSEVMNPLSKAGMEAAMTLLERRGIIPPQATQQDILSQQAAAAQILPREERVRNLVMRLEYRIDSLGWPSTLKFIEELRSFGQFPHHANVETSGHSTFCAGTFSAITPIPIGGSQPRKIQWLGKQYSVNWID